MPPEYTQAGRRLMVQTPLGEDRLLLIGFEGEEQISQPFRFRLEMLSPESDLDHKGVVGRPVTFMVRRTNDSEDPRFFNGIVRRFAYCGENDRLHLYRAEVVPWLWLLSQRSDCRIFSDLNAVQICEQVFRDVGFTDFDFSNVNPVPPTREFCVQYNETDFDFVSRLLEEEGLFYYFAHEDGKHTLVVGDGPGAYVACEDESIELGSTLSGLQRSDDVYRWEHQYEFRGGFASQKDYNFEKPTDHLHAKIGTALPLENTDAMDRFIYPGLHLENGRGDHLVRRRMEGDETAYEVIYAESMCRTLSPGFKFTLARHPNPVEAGKEYAVRKIFHKAALAGSYVTGGDADEIDYQNRFECVPSAVPLRPVRVRPKPLMVGAQTATVTGPGGEEIHTDKYGRVRVQFHWDRRAKADETTSCWIRVAQAHAGSNFGAMFIPRIGQEVVVSFLDGDPDRPLITGSVYNADHMPPYELPGEKTKSTVKTNSTPGGGGFNELRFEDKKGEEQIFIHAERNIDTRVKNDTFEFVGNEKHLIVTSSLYEHVEVDHHETIDRDRVALIGRDHHVTIDGKKAVSIGDSLSLTVKGDVSEAFKKNHSEEVTADYYLKAKNVVIEGLTNITLKVGQSYVAIDAKGVKISGPQVVAEGMAKAEVTAPMTDIKGTGMVNINGGIVKIN